MRPALVIGWMLVTTIASAQDAGATSCDDVLPGSEDAEACAAEAFRMAESSAETLDLDVTAPLASTDLRAAVTEVIRRMSRASQRASVAADAYHQVLRWARPRWTILALAAEGRIYEQLYDSFRSADHFRTEPRLRAAMRFSLDPIECLALVRYVLAVRAARARGIRDPAVTTALVRLRDHEVGRIFQCVAEQEQRDSTFATFSAGELAPLPP